MISFPMEILGIVFLAITIAAAWLIGYLIIQKRSERAQPPPPLPPYGKVHFDDEMITYFRENNEKTSLPWQDLSKLRILTTPDGPFLPDVFWIFESQEEIALKIPSEAEGMAELSDHLTSLSGFQSAPFTKAMGSTEYASFDVWEK